jgi:hypothetical protein
MKRIYELGRELGVKPRAVMDAMHELGLFIRSAASTVTPEEEAQIREKLRHDP